jgi:hypothetical protein
MAENTLAEQAMAPDPNLATANFTYQTLRTIIDTELVPKEYRGKVPKALAAILTGREMGLGPMMSLRYIDVIDGRAAPSGEYMVAQILAAGHIIYASALTDTSCTVVGIRREDGEDRANMEYTFDLAMAERANITRNRSGGLKKNWEHYPEAMLYWRASSQLARMFFADCIAGLSHLPIELDLDRDPEPVMEVRYHDESLDEITAEVTEATVVDDTPPEQIADTVVDVTEAIDERAREKAISLLEWEAGLDYGGRMKCKGACERKDPYTSDSFCCQDAHLRRLYQLLPVAYDLPHDDHHADLLHQALDKFEPGTKHIGDLNKAPLEKLLILTKNHALELLYGGNDEPDDA